MAKHKYQKNIKMIMTIGPPPPQPPPWEIEHLYGGPDPFKNTRAKGLPSGSYGAWLLLIILLILLVLGFVGYIFFFFPFFLGAKL